MTSKSSVSSMNYLSAKLVVGLNPTYPSLLSEATLTIKVDLSKDFGPSKSGKTIIVASTEGNVSVPERDEKIGLYETLYDLEQISQGEN